MNEHKEIREALEHYEQFEPSLYWLEKHSEAKQKVFGWLRQLLDESEAWKKAYERVLGENQAQAKEIEQLQIAFELLRKLDAYIDFGTPFLDGELGILNTSGINEVFDTIKKYFECKALIGNQEEPHPPMPRITKFLSDEEAKKYLEEGI